MHVDASRGTPRSFVIFVLFLPCILFYFSVHTSSGPLVDYPWSFILLSYTVFWGEGGGGEGRCAARIIYIYMLLLLLLFLTFSVLVANPKKLLYTVANPARGLLNREKRTKEKVWQHTPPPTPHTARSEKINKITRRIYRRYAGGRSRVRTRIPSARRLGLWVWLRKILHSRLR